MLLIAQINYMENIMQILTRYLLQKLFGPGVAGVTSKLSILYPDLPSNMVSFSHSQNVTIYLLRPPYGAKSGRIMQWICKR